MNTPRLVAGIVVRGGLHVQSFRFGRYLPIGCPIESAREFDRWGIDEIALIMLDDAPVANRKLVSDVSGAIAVPLAAIGGIRHLDDARDYISCGADKLGFNRCLSDDPELVRETSRLFGQQCAIASVDAVRRKDQVLRWDYWRETNSGKDLSAWIREVEGLGAGEILLNFPEHDGTGLGMDLEAIHRAVRATCLPLVAMGGIGTSAHAVDCFRSAHPSGICVGNRLAHFEQSVLLFKQALATAGAPVRKGVKACYADSPTDAAGRPAKKDDAVLADLLFQRIEPETI
jgi:cyclase